MIHKITYVNNGVACVYKDGEIELHKDLALPQYQELAQRIIAHEQAHDFNKGFWYNFKTDLIHNVPSFRLLRFMITRPSTWTQLLPVYYTKEKGLTYDINVSLFWIALASTIIIFKYILGLL